MVGNLKIMKTVAIAAVLIGVMLFGGCIHYEKRPKDTSAAVTTEQWESESTDAEASVTESFVTEPPETEPPVTEPITTEPSVSETTVTEPSETALGTDANGFPNVPEDGATKRY